MLTLDEVIAKEMENPEFKAEWDALEPEFQIIRAVIEGREARQFSEEQLSEVTGISPAFADLLEARTARLNGYRGRDGFDVLSDMREAIDMETGNGEV